jgi:holo-[acyl-carrier protein] synthase
MMILGLGIDIVEIRRIAKMMEKHTGFVERILSAEERALLPSAGEWRLAEYVAGRFAAKEAASKALGTGIGGSLGFHDIRITKEAGGRPLLQLAPAALARLFPEQHDRLRFHLSISHSKEYAAAQVIIETTR